MTPPPEYDQVAQWMRAISGDPGLLDEIRAGYPGAGQVLGEEFVEQQRQLLANEARSALSRIDLEGKSLDEVAEAYHQDQVAEYARRDRALRERIRELTSGGFEVPSWCAYQAARDGIELELVIEEHRQNELADARMDLGLLPRRYQVTADEAETYWAVQHLAAARHLVDEHHAEPGRVARDAPTLEQLQGIHEAAHKHPGASWGQAVMQARADTWWAARNRQYRNRPEVLKEIERLRAEATDPPEPSAEEDPGEWKTFFREVLGRDIPQDAAYKSAAERQGMPLDQLYAERYQELQASQSDPGAAATGTDAARLAGASFPGPVQPSPSAGGSSEALRRTPSSHPRPAKGHGGDL